MCQWVVKVFRMWINHRVCDCWSWEGWVDRLQHICQWSNSQGVASEGKTPSGYCRTSDGKFYKTPIQRIVRQEQMSHDWKTNIGDKEQVWTGQIHPSLTHFKYSWLSHNAYGQDSPQVYAILDLCKMKICHTMWHHVPYVTPAKSVTSQGNSPPHHICCIGLNHLSNVHLFLFFTSIFVLNSPHSTAIWWVNFMHWFSSWHPDVQLGQKNKTIIHFFMMCHHAHL